MAFPKGQPWVPHGMSYTATYQSWQSMKRRCNASPTHKDHYTNYVQRGIKVCVRWQTFLNFLADMGERPAGATLERTDNDKGYEPGNCKWATQSEQLRNTRRTIRLTFNGKTQSLADWADEIGIHREVLRHRLSYHGWSVEKALTTPVGTTRFQKGHPWHSH